ncbi:TetR/AcrR family transcriptional regulator [Polymorphospora rubra]|uniref:TetR family transcriptional regulator n=1 Tax=Polymorphospora rubra TaxID=338584 RepID=A0A810NAI1_9ACTN|nr:TetR/AcrR family transcriptional regulator [Polymorphospora rubra]BCJ70416.1 TetR family transcriptional regulator [Polymorphospora rubra]
MAASRSARNAPRTRRPRNADDRRAEIVLRAAELFDEVGYHLTSMDDIARAVGLSKPTLYHYFTSKDSILLAIHEEFISILLGRQRQRLEQDDRGTSDLLLDVMVDICDLMRTHRGYVRVFFEHHRELPEASRAKALAARDAYFDSVRGLFERGRAESLLAGDPMLNSMALFGMCNWAYQWYDPRGTLTSLDVARHFHRILLQGVERRPT